jgi:mevalonate kinase
MKICAPGKLILSGEHAVVYGQPALAMAVDRHVRATITRECLPQILFDLSNLAHRSYLSFDGLQQLKERIKRQYRRFIRGEFSICDVLQKPFELVQFALAVLTEAVNISLPHGMKIQVQSDIPIGCGMGSSAATILSVMHAISTYLRVSLSPETLFQLALKAERAQHGRSSGLDLRVTLQGGCMYLHRQVIAMRQPPTIPLYLVHTGMPSTTTGQCVEQVAAHFRSPHLGEAFATVTNAMDAALQAQFHQGVQEAVRANHQLLVQIGVVPERVQQFITQVEQRGGAAKICGAGAVAGDHAGAVLALAEDQPALHALCMRFGYALLPIGCELRGLHAA